MTALLADAIKARDQDLLFMLLEQWGLWSHGFGCRGYRTNQPAPGYWIDDDTALTIDKAMTAVKAERPQVYEILRLRFVMDMSAGEIEDVMCRRARARITRGVKHWADAGVVAMMLGMGVRMVREQLRRLTYAQL